MASDAGDCPVTPLGHRDGRFFFFDAVGQLRALNAQQLGQAPQIVALFGGDMRWCVGMFPQVDKEGNLTDWFSVRKAGADMVRRCLAAGLFSADEPQRGVGVWRAAGRVAVHLGGRVYWPDDDSFQPAGFRARGALWPAHPAIPAPAAPCGPEVVEQVEGMFRRWAWVRDGFGASAQSDAAVFMGLWASGLLGAAIGWRPHGLVVGPPGSGKSSLMELYSALSPLAVMANDYTEAGLRQSVTGRAAPLILDEADEDPESMGRLQRVISLLRRASGGSGAQVVRGSGDGHAQRFEVMSPALLGAVLPPPLQPQDATRITRVDLLPRPRVGAGMLPGPEGIIWAQGQAAGLWGRALAGLPRFMANLELLRAVLRERGCAPRLADQVGTILAARGMMLADEPMGGSEAEEAILTASWLVLTADQQDEDGGPRACWQHLMASASDVIESGRHPSLAHLVERGLQADEATTRQALIDHGLRLAGWPRPRDDALHLFIANRHPRLERIFDGTQWTGGRWNEDLCRLPGAVRPESPVSFRQGFKPRCIVLPPSVLLEGVA